ncbi:MAG TPA: hypothetical protein VFY89_05355 [Ktedonobacterales bacterium]
MGALVVALGVSVLLAGCDGGSTARTPTASPSATGRQTPTASATTGGGEASPVPTLSPVATAQSQAGAGDVCDQAKNVTAQPPSSIPGYPGAELHVSFIQNGSGLFGYCSSAAPSEIANFYTQQLPGKGWSAVQSHPLGQYQQVTGSQGETQLTITISPDARQSNVTDILITAQGL